MYDLRLPVYFQINTMRSLPHRTEADESVINDLLGALQGGADHAQQRGTLMAFIAQCQSIYMRQYGIPGAFSN
jgi:hypothetical protein